MRPVSAGPTTRHTLTSASVFAVSAAHIAAVDCTGPPCASHHCLATTTSTRRLQTSSGSGGSVEPSPQENSAVSLHGMPAPDVDCPCSPIVATAEEPSRTVIWATVTVPAGPWSGFSQNTAPSVLSRPLNSVQDVKLRPIALRSLLASPSVTPTVSQESYALVGSATTKTGLVPPMFDPNGVAAWNAGGMLIGVSATPNIEYRFVASSPSVTLRRYVV